jgi:hypothetical protein
MKQLFFFSLLLATLSSVGQTTTYHSFPDSNAIWNFHYQAYCFANGSGNEYYSITINGDTLINNQTYRQLKTPSVLSFSTGNCGGFHSGYRGAIRNDAANKKVFYVPPTDSTEQLLYDFNMQVGDTLKGYIASFAIQTDTVQSIDSVLVGNTYRKRWIINNCYNVHFIEGIGSVYGLLERSPGCVTDLPDYSLTCFQQTGQVIYPTSTINCQIITSAKTLKNQSHQIQIFPNPSNGSFKINFESNDIHTINLTDLVGKAILERQVINEQNVNIDRLKSGTYILTLFHKNGKTTKRKIISAP